MNLESLELFTTDEHQPFLWNGGQPAALFVHGFPGTPAEFRPLAEVMHRAGWTTQGLLLPGFGPQIASLPGRNYREWIEAAVNALVELQAKHKPVVLAGFSMGAAVALNAAAQQPPDGLVLMAPFWRIGTWTQYLLWQAFKRILGHVQPFKKADFNDPKLQAGFANFGGLDIADPSIQDAVRELRVPARLLDQVFATGRAARKAAAKIQVPTLVIQGTEDSLVRRAHTRRLLQNMSGPLAYEELKTDHDVVDPDTATWPQLTERVLAFAGRIVESIGEAPPADTQHISLS